MASVAVWGVASHERRILPRPGVIELGELAFKTIQRTLEFRDVASEVLSLTMFAELTDDQVSASLTGSAPS